MEDVLRRHGRHRGLLAALANGAVSLRSTERERLRASEAYRNSAAARGRRMLHGLFVPALASPGSGCGRSRCRTCSCWYHGRTSPSDSIQQTVIGNFSSLMSPGTLAPDRSRSTRHITPPPDRQFRAGDLRQPALMASGGSATRYSCAVARRLRAAFRLPIPPDQIHSQHGHRQRFSSVKSSRRARRPITASQRDTYVGGVPNTPSQTFIPQSQLRRPVRSRLAGQSAGATNTTRRITGSRSI